MNPEERRLLERSLKLSEDNNRMLRKIERRARWAILWGIVKLLIIIVPFAAGYIILEPYFNEIGRNYGSFREVISNFNNLPF